MLPLLAEAEGSLDADAKRFVTSAERDVTPAGIDRDGSNCTCRMQRRSTRRNQLRICEGELRREHERQRERGAPSL